MLSMVIIEQLQNKTNSPTNFVFVQFVHLNALAHSDRGINKCTNIMDSFRSVYAKGVVILPLYPQDKLNDD